MKLKDNGAHFYKCDFQIHSPRDPQWKGSGAITEEERKNYAVEFVKKCREKEINAIAISDHHDMEFVDYIRDAANSETDDEEQLIPKNERLVVFPAIELTLRVPCQAILIFDADLKCEEFPKVYQALGIEPVSKIKEKNQHPVVQANFDNLNDVISKLNEVKSLSGRFILLPNISNGGQHTLIRNGFKEKYKDMSCVGGYADGSYAKLIKDNGHLKKISGADPEWGKKKIAVFCTSDSRNRDYSLLGTAHTWVKWTEPTAEALRQACLAQESRISQDSPNLPSSYISRVIVSNSKFMGPIDLMLNPQYNSIIGGRGSGKSTILEYIRWALADQFILEDEVESSQKRRLKLLDNTLLNLEGHISIEFVKNGVVHILKRSTKTNEATIKIGEDGKFQPCTDKEVRSLLSVQAYSQKQLSSVGVRIDELVRLITTPVNSFLISQREDLEKISTQIKRQYSQVKEVKDLDHEISKYELEKISLDGQLKTLRKNLKGLTDKEKELIKEFEVLSSDDEVVDSYLSDFDEAKKVVADALENLEEYTGQYEIPDGSPNKIFLESMAKEYLDGIEKIKKHFSTANEFLSSESSQYAFRNFNKKCSEWESKKEALTKSYEKIKVKATAQKDVLAKIKQIEDRKKEITKLVGSKKIKRDRLGDPSIEMKKLMANWKERINAATFKLKEESDKLNELSNGLIKSEIKQLGDFKSKVEEFKNLAKGARIQQDKIELLFDKICKSEDVTSKWCDFIFELESLISCNRKEEKIDVSGVETLLLDSVQIGDSAKKAIAEKVSSDAWLEFSFNVPPDKPIFHYSSVDGDSIPFEDSSAGQQATAIMNVLLGQDGPPLIIDQPEDDLDSLVIKEIVSRIWSAKTKRQIIFSSHNANIVVNGDAELVVCCSYKATGGQTMGQIEVQGAIDNKSVRGFITRIMEGGEDAFKLRKEKYGF